MTRDDMPRVSSGGSTFWTAALVAAAAPFVVILCVVLWRTPFPVSEAVAIFEDVANRAPGHIGLPETSYYRPLFYFAVSSIWYGADALETRLNGIALLQIVPIALLVLALIMHLRPRTALDAAAAGVAVAVLVGSPGFLDNLELPLSYTIVGMPLGLIVWALLNRDPRAWHAPVIVVLTLVAIGFKEQGLVLVPLAVAARWTRAPGATRGLTTALVAIGVAYIALRLSSRGVWPLFEQAVGFGFSEMEPPEATARFGAFPYGIYAYSSASTIANVLFAEPERGVFRILQAWSAGRFQLWQLIHVGTSVGLTALIAWWGVRSAAAARHLGWSRESRAFVATCVVLLACGVLSFNYSRARLGGMAVPFYAIAAYFALRAAAERALAAPRWRSVAAGLALMALAAGWHTRTLGTIQYARATAGRNHTEWLVQLPERRLEFADRPTYLRILESMVEQGAAPNVPGPTPYPEWVALTIGQP